MRSQQLTIIWSAGLHLRAAAVLVRLARSFQCSVRLCVGERFADAGNIMQLLLLSAGLGTNLTVEADGPDEAAALRAMVSFFSNTEHNGSPAEEFEVGQAPTISSQPPTQQP